MTQVALILAGLVAIVAAAFLVYLPAGFAALGLALIFTGWASSPRPSAPRKE